MYNNYMCYCFHCRGFAETNLNIFLVGTINLSVSHDLMEFSAKLVNSSINNKKSMVLCILNVDLNFKHKLTKKL